LASLRQISFSSVSFQSFVFTGLVLGVSWPMAVLVTPGKISMPGVALRILKAAARGTPDISQAYGRHKKPAFDLWL